MKPFPVQQDFRRRPATLATMLVCVLGAALAFAGCRDAELDARSSGLVGDPAPGFTLPAVDGGEASLADYKGKHVVLEWINFDCPYVRKHYDAGNMQALQREYREKGVVWLTINSSAPGKQGHFSNEEIRKRRQAQNWAGDAYLLDTDGKAGRSYGAQTTPHMYIIDPEGVLLYQGAIDDNDSANPDVIPESTNYVRQGLDEALAGKSLSVESTKSYGCSVKY